MTTEMDTRFSDPSEQLVRNAIRELDYGERLTIYKMNAALGNSPLDIYSFPQLVNNLFGVRWDRLLAEGSKADLVWVDSETLTRWLRDVVGDAEFADAVAEDLQGADHYKAQIEAMTPLFRERVAQYQAVLSAEQDEEAG